jgi:hypothetical protein
MHFILNIKSIIFNILILFLQTEGASQPEQNDGKDTPTEEAMEVAETTNGGTAEDGEAGEAAEAGDQDEEKKEEKGDKDEGEEDDDDDDDSDDDIQVTIGDIKTSTTYASSMNMKRGPADKAKVCPKNIFCDS